MKEQKPMTMAIERRQPTFTTVDARTAHSLLREPGSRRDWTSVREALFKGERLFLSEEEFTKQNSKYLSLSLRRLGHKGPLHVRKVTYEETPGFLLWLDS